MSKVEGRVRITAPAGINDEKEKRVNDLIYYFFSIKKRLRFMLQSWIAIALLVAILSAISLYSQSGAVEKMLITGGVFLVLQLLTLPLLLNLQRASQQLADLADRKIIERHIFWGFLALLPVLITSSICFLIFSWSLDALLIEYGASIKTFWLLFTLATIIWVCLFAFAVLDVFVDAIKDRLLVRFISKPIFVSFVAILSASIVAAIASFPVWSRFL